MNIHKNDRKFAERNCIVGEKFIMKEKKQNEGFSSLFGFLMTIIGFAVGVGSLWRFPYVCGSNGGALFILTYVIVIAIVGLPLLTAEISMGYVSQKTALDAYKTIKPGTKWYRAAYLHIVVALLIFCYTVPIYVWVLSYIWRTAKGFFMGLDPAAIEASFYALNADKGEMSILAIINWILIGLIVSGVIGGVEKVNKILLPALAVIMVVCIIIGLNVEGSFAGLEYLFKPNFEAFSFEAVTAAMGQAFFAVSIGMLGSMIFGSYIKDKKANLVKQSSIVCGSIVVAGISAGLMIFPLVFAFGLEPSAGTGLTMITLPNVFNHITGGRILGTIFYIGFYFAALSSAIGLGEALTAVFEDIFSISRKKALTLVMAASIIIGSCAILIPGFLDFFDVLAGNYLLIISGLLIAIFVGWVWGADNFLDAIHVKNKFVRTWLKVSVKYLCPVIICFILVVNLASLV